MEKIRDEKNEDRNENITKEIEKDIIHLKEKRDELRLFLEEQSFFNFILFYH